MCTKEQGSTDSMLGGTRSSPGLGPSPEADGGRKVLQPSSLERLEKRKEAGKEALSAVGGSSGRTWMPAGRSLSLTPEKLLPWCLREPMWELWGVPAGLAAELDSVSSVGVTAETPEMAPFPQPLQ